MTLDKPRLEEKIKDAFVKAKETPPPEDPAESEQLQDQILTDLARDLAEAIREFVADGEVMGVTSEVELDIPNNTGQGAQVGSVKVQ